MKYEIHYPTEQYGFILKVFEGTDAEAVSEYNSLKMAWVGGSGLAVKDFNSFIDRQLMGESNHIEDYNLMNREQQSVAQEIKKALKRIRVRESNEYPNSFTSEAEQSISEPTN